MNSGKRRKSPSPDPSPKGRGKAGLAISPSLGEGDRAWAIAIDLGGTYIKAAIVTSQGKILKQTQLPTFADVSPRKVISQIEKAISSFLRRAARRAEWAGLGIGAPGIVHDGVVKYPPNFRNWKEIDLKKIFSKKYKTRVEVDNDANCGGLAELHFGYGKKYKSFLYLTLGTGVGGAIVNDGKLFRGEYNGAGEFGMMTINFDGPPCLGGNPGAVEAYIGRNYFLEAEKAIMTKLGKETDFKDLVVHASNGSRAAKSLLKKYGFYLGVGLTNYFNLMDVRTCVLGGGISNGYKYFISECNKTIKERALPTIRNKFRVLKSRLPEPGILGAALLVLSPFEGGRGMFHVRNP
jgi:glucokinase